MSLLNNNKRLSYFVYALFLSCNLHYGAITRASVYAHNTCNLSELVTLGRQTP